MATDNNFIQERGAGTWVVVTYKPEASCGAIKGYLDIGKDFHTFYLKTEGGNKKYIASFPSQNVAYVYDSRYVAPEQHLDDNEES